MSRVTLKQVANHAGVSYQTVSKVLNNKARVSKKTEERIWQSVRALGYHPDQLARSLRAQRSSLIGYSWEPTLAGQANSILDQFVQSLSEAAESAGYHLLTFSPRPVKEWINAYRELIETNRVDGFVLSGVEYNDPRIPFLQEKRIHFVAFGRSNPGWDFPYVDVDGALGMRLITGHLIRQGHRRIAALALPQDSRVGQNRMEGFLAALREAGLSAPIEWIARGDGVYQFGREAARRLLDQPYSHRPTAIVGFNDALAIGAMHAAMDIGLRVGVDVAITGFEDSPAAQYLIPRLTSIRQPVWEAGQIATRLLLAKLNDTHVNDQHILLAPELIVRESSCQ